MRYSRWLAIACASVSLTACSSDLGHTTIENWPDGKRAAVSLTYDGGTINQFDIALPMMNEHGLPATFFIVTGDIEGSQFRRRFLGRSVEEIAAEVSGGAPTTEENFYERAGAVRMLPYREAIDYHTRAGDLFELGRTEEAYATIEEAYRKAQQGELTPLPAGERDNNPDVDVTWDELRAFADEGHEFASHSVSHAQLATLDDVNLAYELEKSREEISKFLGEEHTFSVEAPYGTENPRVMEQLLALYPASRNRMPEDFLEEINRWNDADPAVSEREYVQWQRGPKSATPLEEMKSWVGRAASGDNVWLVLVFHGVEGVGWEPMPAAELEEYFGYLAGREDVWVATFGDAAKYMRERMAATVTATHRDKEIHVDLTHALDANLYAVPLTLTTQIPETWSAVTVTQGDSRRVAEKAQNADGEWIVSYEAVPNAEVVVLRDASES